MVSVFFNLKESNSYGLTQLLDSFMEGKKKFFKRVEQYRQMIK
jgi:hypothetical protein